MSIPEMIMRRRRRRRGGVVQRGTLQSDGCFFEARGG
jgi:hypothetical protein